MNLSSTWFWASAGHFEDQYFMIRGDIDGSSFRILIVSHLELPLMELWRAYHHAYIFEFDRPRVVYILTKKTLQKNSDLRFRDIVFTHFRQLTL